MRPEERGAAYMWDMLNAAREAHMTVEDTACDTFMDDWLRRRALERTLEVLGEAARKVSVEFQSAHPDIDWHGLIGQRNVLAHEYGASITACYSKPPMIACRRLSHVCGICLIKRRHSISPCLDGTDWRTNEPGSANLHRTRNCFRRDGAEIRYIYLRCHRS